eukprot:m.543570 g.543570  ORF g.543570 m.543570 type:complete len:299 (-) comp57667_c0_seq59:775-1671(-)
MLGHLLKLQASSHTIDTNTDDGEYPLVAAIAGGSIECLQLLVAAGTQMSTCLLGEEGSVLHVAAENSRTAMLLHLLQIDMFRAQVNSIGRLGYTPLLCAVRSGCVDCFRHLLEAGADLRIKNEHGQSVLHVGEQTAQVYMVEHMLSISAIRQDINAVDDWGETALFQAVQQDDLHCARAIVSAGADLATRGGDGKTVLHHAAPLNHAGMLQFLLESGASNLDAQDETGSTALISAVSFDRPAHARVLLAVEPIPPCKQRAGRQRCTLLLSTRILPSWMSCCMPVSTKSMFKMQKETHR